MKRILTTMIAISCLLAFTVSTTFAGNHPASKEWVLQQIAANSPLLTAADWSAVCASGSPAGASGCYGNASSAAFAKVSNLVGGFNRYANINPVNAPSSVFIKAFFAGTNTPAQATNLNVHVINSAARCALFTQVGHGLGLGGISTTNPSSGSTSSAFTILHAVSFVTINNTTSTGLYYNAENIGTGVTPLSNVAVPNPIYLLCAGYNTTDGSTAAPVNITAT
jgi:hypothetical protein